MTQIRHSLLVEDDQIVRDNRLPVHCRHLAATSYCHPGRYVNVVIPCSYSNAHVFYVPKKTNHPLPKQPLFEHSNAGHILTGPTSLRADEICPTSLASRQHMKREETRNNLDQESHVNPRLSHLQRPGMPPFSWLEVGSWRHHP